MLGNFPRLKSVTLSDGNQKAGPSEVMTGTCELGPNKHLQNLETNNPLEKTSKIPL